MDTMQEPITIQFKPESELADILAQAEERPVILHKDGVRFRIERVPQDISAGYDSERVRAAFESIHGLLAGVDTEALKADLRSIAVRWTGNDCLAGRDRIIRPGPNWRQAITPDCSADRPTRRRAEPAAV